MNALPIFKKYSTQVSPGQFNDSPAMGPGHLIFYAAQGIKSSARLQSYCFGSQSQRKHGIGEGVFVLWVWVVVGLCSVF